ncbi:MAG: Xaa-Pro aminopeptidase [Euryarchaeota archaeon]|nr:Xaa-Pro aminopeptidase [Euryarchaeota archaeon]
MDIPFDSSEYMDRQDRLFSQLPDSTILIIPTNDRKTRSNDVGYPFRANSYMLYLCGWSEDEGVFVAHNGNGAVESKLFVPERDTTKEIWEGIRIGVEGAKSWPVSSTTSIDNLESEILQMIDKYDHVYTIPGISKTMDNICKEVAEVSDPRPIIDPMRRIKSAKEIEYMREAASIGARSHKMAMKRAFPGMGEWEIQSYVEGHFIKSKSTWSFPSIVGGGSNATILHYKNNDCVVNDGDLVLVDAGCEVNGYASDITRTWPVNGKFTEPQKEIYDLVLKAEIAGISACQVGATWASIHSAASEVLAKGLIELGILNCSLEEAIGDPIEFDGQYRNFFMHGTGHFLGLDVHDVGGGRQGDDDKGPTLEEGMVLTIEPGLYFADWREDIEIPDRYAGIGIRIEDDVLVTEDGPVVLSSACPKEISEIEEIVGSRD